MQRLLIYLHGSIKPLCFLFEGSERADEALSSFDSDISNAPNGELIYLGDERGMVGFLKRDFQYFEMPRCDIAEDDEETNEDEPVLENTLPGFTESLAPKRSGRPKVTPSLQEIQSELSKIAHCLEGS